ncbi:hypothetical protein [uncultured Salinisphaera sp.]|uniref:hypothetical protein n=1 Tax=uncultured Salinisphaera sp. TaxID=359372 RepID=UPI0032B288B3
MSAWPRTTAPAIIPNDKIGRKKQPPDARGRASISRAPNPGDFVHRLRKSALAVAIKAKKRECRVEKQIHHDTTIALGLVFRAMLLYNPVGKSGFAQRLGGDRDRVMQLRRNFSSL